MKKLFLFLTIATLSFISCSEDEETHSKDPIIGSWYTFSINGKAVLECAKEYHTIYKDNGDYTSNNFEITPDNKCNKLEVITAKWEKKDSSTYTLVRGNKKLNGKVTFSDNNNTMTLIIDEKIVYKRK